MTTDKLLPSDYMQQNQFTPEARQRIREENIANWKRWGILDEIKCDVHGFDPELSPKKVQEREMEQAIARTVSAPPKPPPPKPRPAPPISKQATQGRKGRPLEL